MLKKNKDNSALVPVKKKKMTKMRLAFILFACTGPILEWLIWYVYANGAAFGMAFTNSKGEFSLDNFVHLWNDLTEPGSVIIVALRNTLLHFTIGLLHFPLRVLISYFIYKKVPGTAVYRVVFFLPRLIFSVAISMIVIRLLGVNGIIAEAVQSLLGLEAPPELLADSRYALIVVILEGLWIGFPGDLIIWGGAFARIPVDVLESGQIDGVTWWTEFTKIIVPLVWPTVALKMVLSVCGIFGSSAAEFLLCGGRYGTMTLHTWLYTEVLGGASSSNPYVFNYMSTVGFCMTVIAIAISLSVRRIVDNVFNDVDY